MMHFDFSVASIIQVLCWLSMISDELKQLKTRSNIVEVLGACKSGFPYEDESATAWTLETETQSQTPQSQACHPYLDCKEIEEIEIIRELCGGYVKQMFLGKWRNMHVVLSQPRTHLYADDFDHGVKMITQLQEGGHVVQLVGFCQDKNLLVTKYCKLGSAEQLRQALEQRSITNKEEFFIRLQLAQDYIKIMHYLHNSPLGTRVMCDSNDLNKTLSQFLITDDLRLTVADLDALPEVNRNKNQLVKCGKRQLFGTFVAPEQRWPYESQPFDPKGMPPYDEKTDIWKIPAVVNYFLGGSIFADRFRFMLFDLFKRCKSIDPKDRPSAKQILRTFNHSKEIVLKELNQVHAVDEL